MGRSIPLAIRFERYVKRGDGCWLWTGGKISTGYGSITRGGRKAGTILAHRASWEIAYGPIPAGLYVLHHCDNRPCVRPDHLFLGDHLANMQDAARKGWKASGDRNGTRLHPETLRRGSAHPGSKLNDTAIRLIRTARANGDGPVSIARSFGVSEAAIRAITSGRTWTHVT